MRSVDQSAIRYYRPIRAIILKTFLIKKTIRIFKFCKIIFIGYIKLWIVTWFVTWWSALRWWRWWARIFCGRDTCCLAWIISSFWLTFTNWWLIRFLICCRSLIGSCHQPISVHKSQLKLKTFLRHSRKSSLMRFMRQRFIHFIRIFDMLSLAPIDFLWWRWRARILCRRNTGCLA